MPHSASESESAALTGGAPLSGETSSLVAVLRQATAPAHAAIEHLPAMTRLNSPAVTREDYLDYLRSMARVYASLEPPLLAAIERARAAHPDLDLPVAPKLPALLADLAAQGLTLPDPACEPQPRPAPEGLGEVLGGIYVLEGATLGGRVIARHLRRHLGDSAGSPLAGMRFLDFHGEAASPVWKAFAAGLDRLAALGAVDRQAAIAGACDTFERIRQMLESPQIEPTARR